MNINGREHVWSDDHMAWVPVQPPARKDPYRWKLLAVWLTATALLTAYLLLVFAR